MPTVRVEETVEVPQEALFAILTDHEGFDRFRDTIRSAAALASERAA